MAKTQTILQVFVGSPSDLNEERAILEEVVGEFNQTWGHNQGVLLELLKWETHTHPGFGVDAQDVINKQIGDDYDIFLGIMWGRFGSPTDRAESGTEEEFNRAYSRLSTDPNSVQIMFYFKDAGIAPSEVDITQLQKVQNFKKKIAEEYGAYYRSFNILEEFQSNVRMHLSKVVQDWLNTNESNTSSVVTSTEKNTSSSYKDNPLSNLVALEVEYDQKGILEFIELANNSMDKVMNSIRNMTIAVNNLAEAINNRTVELTDKSNLKSTVETEIFIYNKAADNFEIFVNEIIVELLQFNLHNFNAMEAFGNIAMIVKSDLKMYEHNIRNEQVYIQKYSNLVERTILPLSKFRDTIFNLPSKTAKYNHSKRRAIAISDDLLKQMRITVNQSKDVESLLARLVDT